MDSASLLSRGVLWYHYIARRYFGQHEGATTCKTGIGFSHSVQWKTVTVVVRRAWNAVENRTCWAITVTVKEKFHTHGWKYARAS